MHAMAAVYTAILQYVLGAHCATAKGLGPTTPLHQKGRGDARETHKRCNIKRFQASNPGSHATPIT